MSYELASKYSDVVNNATIKSRLDKLEKKISEQEVAPTNCRNCGAPLDANGKCQYCGAIYKTERQGNELHVIEVEHPRVQKLVAVYRINNEDLLRYPEEAVARMAFGEMKRGMVDQLTDFIRITKEQDPYMNCTLIRGEIRVVEPNFMF